MRSLTLLLVLIGCEAASPMPEYLLDDVLTFSDVQAKGTHNSYHIEPEIVFDDSHRYTHRPLKEQLEFQGVRQFELDIHYHTNDGFQVFHIPGLDAETTCVQLSDCLQTIKDWSDENPHHMPLMTWFELKDDIDEFVPELESLEGRYSDLEDAVLQVWPRERIVTPDEVRGNAKTLPEAITTKGWPTLGAMRGRIVFALLESGIHRENYLEGAPALENRLFFVGASSEEDPYAAVFKINDARGGAERVAGLITRGFSVTCNTDSADGSDGDNADKLAASLASGVSFLSSDWPGPVDNKDYWFDLPDGAPARCNPVHAPETCTSADIETDP